jgi:hypothetical protein
LLAEADDFDREVEQLRNNDTTSSALSQPQMYDRPADPALERRDDA